jgi:hypothetical protein
MAKKRKTPQKRLKEAIDRARGPQLRDLLPKPDYSEVWDRRIAADFALTFSDQPIDASLRIAFEIFRLDPKDPYHWRDLLRILSGILFEPPAVKSSDKSPANSSGAPRKWDESRRRLFDHAVVWARERVKKILRERGEPETITHNDIARYLKLTLPQFSAVKLETLRKYIASGPPKGGAVK